MPLNENPRDTGPQPVQDEQGFLQVLNDVRLVQPLRPYRDAPILNGPGG